MLVSSHRNCIDLSHSHRVRVEAIRSGGSSSSPTPLFPGTVTSDLPASSEIRMLQVPGMNGLNIEAVLAVNLVLALECARTIRHTKFGAKDPLIFSPYMARTCIIVKLPTEFCYSGPADVDIKYQVNSNSTNYLEIYGEISPVLRRLSLNNVFQGRLSNPLSLK